MSRLTDRISSLEQQARIRDKSRPSSPAELRRNWENTAAQYGMTLDEAVAKHGTIGAFYYWVLMQDDHDTPTPPDDGLSPMERYMRLLDG